MKNLKANKFVYMLLFLLVSNLVILAGGWNTLPDYFIWIGIFLVSTILISYVLRRYLWFKPILTSKFNLLSSKSRYHQEFDFPQDLFFDKTIEIIHSMGFEIVDSNKEEGKILAIAPMSMYSNGETLYVDIIEENGITQLDFISVCPQIYSYGKNRKNYEQLISEFEKALTI